MKNGVSSILTHHTHHTLTLLVTRKLTRKITHALPHFCHISAPSKKSPEASSSTMSKPFQPCTDTGSSDPGVARAAAVPTRALSRTQDQMPTLGLGMWKVPNDVTAQCVVDAISAGWRHFDCACDYGNEIEVGEGLRQAIASGVVRRQDLWITSKLWNTYHSPEHVRIACQKTLDDLGLDYLDLYLIHFPIALKYVPIEERYPPEWVHDPSGPNPRMEFASVSCGLLSTFYSVLKVFSTAFVSLFFSS